MKISMRATPFIMKQAIMHMIGQMQDMSLTCKTGDMARFLNVTKPTAQRYLKQLAYDGMLKCVTREYRKNARCFWWELSHRSRVYYEGRVFKISYDTFMQEKWSM